MLHLTRWGVPPSEAETIIERLRIEQFIDDERYALAFARDYTRFQKWGSLKIVHALRAKGIPSNIIKSVLLQIDAEGISVDFEELIRKKLQSFPPTENGQKLYAKLVRFALSRGFTLDEAHEGVQKVLRECRDC